ncbi:response regulator transcription factor [Candidatus Weimeria sp. HCP3S3_B5]|uniref:response regulator transcription factor n=1 Tax=Candidatus Weimeria sp. HCP3S3_B5 TaxID=3438871 RepID=UPI003062D2DA|nr:response regulator transcription factor [Lachnospiraceae bacterium]
MKILLAEDTRDLNRAETAILTHEGYDVTSAYDGEQAVDCLEQDSFDAAILDIMMPKLDGIGVLKYMRENNILTPVLLLTAKTEVDDRVAGLDAGADDYLAKPFDMRELLARVRALVRRGREYNPKDMSFGDVSLKAEEMELSCENSVRLSAREFELMQLLMTHADGELSTDDILQKVWAAEPAADADTVWLYISYLKRKLTAIDSDLTINGEKGGGFRLDTDPSGRSHE